MATLAYRDISRTSVKQSVPDPPITPPIQEVFINKGVDHGGQVAMISNKGHIKGASDFIHECAPGKELKNWTVVEIP